MILAEARKKKGLTIEELAKAVGVSSAAISRYEHGKRVPKVAIAKRIGKVLQVKWFELIDSNAG